MVEEKKESAAIAKPAEFFIGLVDFFAILLPGGLATVVLLQLAKSSRELRCLYFQSLFSDIPSGLYWPYWVAFAVVSYLLGHFIFLIDSVSLDNIYDLTFKRVTRDKDEADRLIEDAKRIIRIAQQAPENREIQSVFQWARVYARLRSPATALEIDRLEADSKFFRSLTILLFLSGFLVPAAMSEDIGWDIFAIAVVLLCFAAAVAIGDWRETDKQKKRKHEKIQLKAYYGWKQRQSSNEEGSGDNDWLSAEKG